MKIGRCTTALRRRLAVLIAGTACALPLGSCDLGEFTTTSTVTLSGREVVEYLVESAILTPLNTYVGDRVDDLLDQFDPDDE
ncbi:MAG: hypothetical protein GY842_19425 [bacterium]|nr:hypothetical protein [bacterium]